MKELITIITTATNKNVESENKTILRRTQLKISYESSCLSP